MKLKTTLGVLGVLATLWLGGGNLLAQDNDRGGPGNPGGPGGPGDDRPPGDFDPAQFRQRMFEHIQKSLNVTNDAEWSAIQPLVQKVMEARREADMGRVGMRGPGGPGGPGGGPGGPGEPGGGPPFGPPESAEQKALQKALDDKAPPALALRRFKPDFSAFFRGFCGRNLFLIFSNILIWKHDIRFRISRASRGSASFDVRHQWRRSDKRKGRIPVLVKRRPSHRGVVFGHALVLDRPQRRADLTHG